jgi:hypothetical protein
MMWTRNVLKCDWYETLWLWAQATSDGNSERKMSNCALGTLPRVEVYALHRPPAWTLQSYAEEVLFFMF